MFKWKLIFYILILFFININCQEEQKDNIIELETEQIEYLSYNNKNTFTFEKTKKNDLLINLYSIDCEINISKNNNFEIKKIKDNIFSILIRNEQIGKQKLNVKAFINSGNNDKSKEFRKCPLVINSLYKNETILNIKEKESMALSFFDDLPFIILSYKIENNNEGFTTLSFLFDGNYTFNVDINNNKITKEISYSSKIFLENSKLSINENENLTIKITLNKEKKFIQNQEPVIIFKIMESNSISILEKNNLNMGFTYSQKDNQYYYLEVFKGEEGEIMIHNKRLYGELYGIIKPKSNINGTITPSEYDKKDNDNQLQFDALTLKLSFKSYQTEQCEKGCYLLVKYSHDDYNSSYNNSIVGFEYTLLVRIWDEEETGSQIINIPFNEYIFGAFEKESINHHYYSLNIPDDTKEIIIQFEGNYIDGFLGSGKRKLNTYRKLNNTKDLNLTENKIIIKYNKNQLNELNIKDCISFAFRSKNYFSQKFSFYYFRILLLKEDENDIIYPLDSNIGTFCSPKLNENETYFFCNCILKNEYNDFSLNYSILTSNKKDRLTYNYLNVTNGIINGTNKEKYITQINFDNKTSLVTFIFENGKIANILSTLSNNSKEMYPQIYSKQIFDIENNRSSFIFHLQRNYLLTLNYIKGQGQIKYQNLTLYLNENFKGKPFFFNLNKDIKDINFQYKGELIFYTKIEESNEFKEINQDETLRELVDPTNLPFYYYIKNGENEINQMNIYYRIKVINSTNRNKIIPFKINVYILGEKMFNDLRNIDRDYININESYIGTYEVSFRIGTLNINKKIEKGHYIIIRIDSNYEFTHEKLLLELLSMPKKDYNYILPVNSYISDTYDSIGKNYTIIIDDEDKACECILVEFIPDCSKMEIKVKDNNNNSIFMEKILDENEIVQKYRIKNFINNFILRVEAPKNISYGNYILRYYFTEEEKEKYYKLNKTFIKRKGNNKNDIILEFNKLELISNNNNKSNKTKTEEEEIKEMVDSFYIYGFLYLNENVIKNVSYNSSYTFQKNIIKNVTYIKENSNFSIYFKDIYNLLDDINKNDFNYIFNLHIKIFVYKRDFFNEEFYLYNIPISLEDELKDHSHLKWIIIIASLGLVIIIVIIISIIIFTKMKKKNANLKEKVLAISFTSGKIDDEIEGRKNTSGKDEDYENTFI